MTVIAPFSPSGLPRGWTPGDLLLPILSGAAASRSDMARFTGLAPSTISLKVEELLRSRLLVEDGEGGRSGRKARALRMNGEAGFVLSCYLGAGHVQIAAADLTGRMLWDREYDVELLDPDCARTVARVWNLVTDLIGEHSLNEANLWAVTVGVPAPVAQPDGRIVSPEFMPTWNGAALGTLFAEHTRAPIAVENDANLYAIAECPPLPGAQDAHLMAVKISAEIGCGIVSGGVLHRGFNGAAGEIAHTPARGESAVPCYCNVPNCLASVASGRAIRARLAADGVVTSSTADLVRHGAQGKPQVVDLLREAGSQIGATLAGFVNFYNPKDVVLGGALSQSSPLVAAIRAELFRTCLPLTTENLDVRVSSVTSGLASVGALRLAVDNALQPERVNEMVARAR